MANLIRLKYFTTTNNKIQQTWTRSYVNICTTHMLTMPTRYNAQYLTLHDNIVTQFTVKHSGYINATTGYLIE